MRARRRRREDDILIARNVAAVRSAGDSGPGGKLGAKSFINKQGHYFPLSYVTPPANGGIYPLPLCRPRHPFADDENAIATRNYVDLN